MGGYAAGIRPALRCTATPRRQRRYRDEVRRGRRVGRGCVAAAQRRRRLRERVAVEAPRPARGRVRRGSTGNRTLRHASHEDRGRPPCSTVTTGRLDARSASSARRAQGAGQPASRLALKSEDVGTSVGVREVDVPLSAGCPPRSARSGRTAPVNEQAGGLTRVDRPGERHRRTSRVRELSGMNRPDGHEISETILLLGLCETGGYTSMSHWASNCRGSFGCGSRSSPCSFDWS